MVRSDFCWTSIKDGVGVDDKIPRTFQMEVAKYFLKFFFVDWM